MLEPLTSESASSSWPTPNTGISSNGHGMRGGRAGNGRQSGADLEAVAKAWAEEHLWPTPRASPNENRTTRSAPSHGHGHGETLAGVACDWGRENLWPTPTVHGNDNRKGLSPTSGDGLQTAAKEWAAENLWPTASARDWKSGEHSQATAERNSRPLNESALAWARTHLAALTSKDGPECLRYDPTLHRLCLNPAFVEWLMGWLTFGEEEWTLPYVRTGFASLGTGFSPSKPTTHGEGSGDRSSETDAAPQEESMRTKPWEEAWRYDEETGEIVGEDGRSIDFMESENGRFGAAANELHDGSRKCITSCEKVRAALAKAGVPLP
jgi:hypothetical protein